MHIPWINDRPGDGSTRWFPARTIRWTDIRHDFLYYLKEREKKKITVTTSNRTIIKKKGQRKSRTLIKKKIRMSWVQTMRPVIVYPTTAILKSILLRAIAHPRLLRVRASSSSSRMSACTHGWIECLLQQLHGTLRSLYSTLSSESSS